MHMPNEALQKVTALITRKQGDQARELLLFRHPTAGVQLPAGTVELGEALEAAAYREVAEETGLTDVQLIEYLGSTVTNLTEGRHLILEPATLQAGPYEGAPSLGWIFGRGSWCSLMNHNGDYAEICYTEMNLNVTPHQVQVRFSGWIPNRILCSTLERHFYHFELTGQTAERWIQHAERDFECYWTPLSPKPRLVEGQNEWLDFAYEKIL